jgi:hypothetical protein
MRSPQELLLWIAKISGYGFFSYSVVAGKFTFKRDWKDIFVMLLSFAFSTCLFCLADGKTYVDLRSVVLNIGIAFVWNFVTFSSVSNKIVNVFGGRKCFSMLKNFNRVDRQVCCRWKARPEKLTFDFSS